TGKSPLVIPAPDTIRVGGTEKLWVRARGHAWQSVEVFLADGGEREVRLYRGCSVKVKVAGEVPRQSGKVALRLYKSSAREPALAEFDGSTEVIDELAAGTYEFRLELGEWYRNPQVLARATVSVKAGDSAEVELKAVSVVAETT